MTLPSPAHALARLAALEAAVNAWAEARRWHSTKPTRRTQGKLRHAEKVLMQLTDPPTGKQA